MQTVANVAATDIGTRSVGAVLVTGRAFNTLINICTGLSIGV